LLEEEVVVEQDMRNPEVGVVELAV